MDISNVLNGQDGDSLDVNTVPTDVTNDDTGTSSGSETNDNDSSNGGKPRTLEFITADGKKFRFNANETISTSDRSAVGDFSAIKQAARRPVAVQPTPMQKGEISAEKMDFIKTYTREFDDAVVATTHAVELILKSIDKTVKEHTNDIEIPEEAIPFIPKDARPANNKVPKFDDAQDIVRNIMAQAQSAKSQSEQAAMEAAKIYDSIQQFKRDTNDQIADIRNRDEFGDPIDQANSTTESSSGDGISSVVDADGSSVSMPKISHS